MGLERKYKAQQAGQVSPEQPMCEAGVEKRRLRPCAARRRSLRRGLSAWRDSSPPEQNRGGAGFLGFRGRVPCCQVASSSRLQLVLRGGGGGLERSEKMVAAIRVPKTKRARRELLKHAPKLVSFHSLPFSSRPRSPAARGVQRASRRAVCRELLRNERRAGFHRPN